MRQPLGAFTSAWIISSIVNAHPRAGVVRSLIQNLPQGLTALALPRGESFDSLFVGHSGGIGTSMNILGINAFHGDASAALLTDGNLISAVEEERFNRIKHWAGFPALAIGVVFERDRPSRVGARRDFTRSPRPALAKTAARSHTARRLEPIEGPGQQ